MATPEDDVAAVQQGEDAMTMTEREWFWYKVMFAAVFICCAVLLFFSLRDIDRKLDTTGCTYWEVARPDAEFGTVWVIGWMKQCGDDWSPLIEFGPEESDVEIILRLEKSFGVSGYKGEQR